MKFFSISWRHLTALSRYQEYWYLVSSSTHHHPVPSPRRRLAATDLQHTLSLALVVHSDILYPVHILMFLFHLYLCLPLSRCPSAFPSSKVFNKESCLLFAQNMLSVWLSIPLAVL